METTIADHWVADLQLEVAAEPLQKVLTVWPVGVLAGGIQEVPRGEDPPEVFWALFSSTARPGGSHPELSGRVVCPVSKTLSWECRVPAGVFDFRFQAAGFVPRYQWGVTVSAGKTRKLGKLDLRRGTSVLGWVRTAEDAPAVGARLSLSPYQAAPVRDRSKLDALTFKSEVNARGFFQVDGVPPGAYVLEATLAPFAPTSTTVKVAEGQVTEVSNPPLILDHPRKIHVYVDPPTDPWDEPWTLQLQHISRNGRQILESKSARVALDGSLDLDNVNPADYRLNLLTSRGDAWWTALREVKEDETLSISLDVVQVEGRTLLAGEPLASDLTFGGSFAAISVKVETDGEGRFTTVLPHAGKWPVQVVSEEHQVNRQLARVEVEPRNGTDKAYVSIQIPDTRLFGVVVDETDQPVERALVSVASRGHQREGRIQVRTDRDGRFEFVGLAKGPALLEAEVFPDSESDVEWVEIGDRKEATSRTIRVRKRKRLQGVVLSRAGGVPGAEIKIAPADAPYIGVRSHRSDVDGRFDFTVPRAAQELFVTVGAPGFALRMLRTPVPGDGRLVLPVEPQGGTLVIEGADAIDYRDPLSRRLFLLHAGSREGVMYLRNWARQQGADGRDLSRITLPNLEPGAYMACRVSSIELPGEDRRAQSADGCVKGELLAHGELVLSLAEPPEQR
jgi:hypothetical protein